jgi:hypothetical protein
MLLVDAGYPGKIDEVVEGADDDVGCGAGTYGGGCGEPSGDP